MGQFHNTTPVGCLVTHLANIPDPRSRRGRRYEWGYLLTLLAAAMMAGESTLVGISQWLASHEQERVRSLQPSYRHVPSLATVRRVLCTISIEVLEQAVGAYLQGLQDEMGESGQLVMLNSQRLQGQAVDGKTLRRASAHQAAQGTAPHLVAVVRHEDGLVLSQASTQAKVDESTQAQALLAALPLKQTVAIFDALPTSRQQATQIRHGEGP